MNSNFPMAFLADSPIQIFVILLIALLFFGHKLPSVARSLGSSVSQFKKGVKDGEDEANADKSTAPEKVAPTPPTSEHK